MADDAANGLTVGWISLPAEYRDTLASIRHWPQLKLATEGETLWVRGFTEAEIYSPAISGIPAATRYLERDGRLALPSHLVPHRAAPALLWTPIARALPITLSAENHNFFGLEPAIEVRLVTSAGLHEINVLRCTRKAVDAYAATAPGARLERLSWMLLGAGEVLVFGTPLLPLPGSAYWQRDSFLIPAGLDFEVPFLAAELENVINPEGSDFILWNEDGCWSRISQANARPFSRSSVRLSAGLPRNTTT